MTQLWYALDMVIEATSSQPITTFTVGVLFMVAVVTYFIAEH